MQIPSTGSDERERLDALHQLDILDTSADRDFDDITTLASDLCGTPISLISLIDSDRQWFKSKSGIEILQTERDVSFCGHAIQNDSVFEVQDTFLDTRFSDNPLVTGDPEIRFYAGAPLITEAGFRLGTLCVIDQVPRLLTASQRNTLVTLSRQVVRLMEFRAISRKLTTISNKLSQTLALQRAVLNSPDLAMISMSRDGTIVSFSDAASRLLRMKSVDVIGRRSLNTFYSNPAQKSAAATDSSHDATAISDFSHLIASTLDGFVGSGEWWLMRGDGVPVLVQSTLTAVRDEGDVCIGYVAILNDITALKAAEARIENSQIFLRKIAERVPGVIYQFRRRPDGSSCFPYMSSGIKLLFDLYPEQICDDASLICARIHPDDLASTTESIDISATTLSAWKHGNRIQLPNGQVRWIFGNALPEKEADGSVLWHGFITDVTEQKHAAMALQSNQRFLKALVANLPVGIYSKSMTPDDRSGGGRYLIWNSAAQRMSGITEQQMIGKLDRDVFPPSIADMHASHDAELLSTRQPVIVPVYAVTRPDGSRRLLRMTSIPLMDSLGEIEYTMGIGEDLTDLLIQQRELQLRTAELEAVNDASPLGLFRTDADGECIYVNRTYEIITGLQASACMGSGWSNAIHPDDKERVFKNWSMSTQETVRYNGTHRCVHACGKIVDVRVQCAPVKIGDEIVGYVGTVDDITDRRAANEAIRSNEKRLRLITDNVPGTIGYINAQERFEFCNLHYTALLGIDHIELIGKTLREAFGEVGYAFIAPYVRGVLSGKNQSFERTMTVHGSVRHQQIEYIADVESDGHVAGFFAMVIDITEIKVNQLRQAEGEKRLRTITDNVPVAISYVDAALRFRFANAATLDWTATSGDEIVGKHVRDVIGPLAFEERHVHFMRVLSGHQVDFVQTSMLMDKERVLQSSYIPDRAEDGSVIGFYSLSSDVSALKQTEKELMQLARFDSLTGLKNRASLFESIRDGLARCRRNQTTMALMYLDIDHFKQINDSLGHGIGDLVLQEFARPLKRSVRETDTVARLGGDEFVVVLESPKSEEDTRTVAQKILEQVRAPWLLNGSKLSITTSIGVVHAVKHGPQPEELLKLADECLYQAKRGGRDRFSLVLAPDGQGV